MKYNNIFEFTKDINRGALRDDQVKEAVRWLNNYKENVYDEFDEYLYELYLLLLDFAYYKVQDRLTIYKIKKYSESLEESKETNIGPYLSANKKYKDILKKAMYTLKLKYCDLEDENYWKYYYDMLENDSFKVKSVLRTNIVKTLESFVLPENKNYIY